MGWAVVTQWLEHWWLRPATWAQFPATPCLFPPLYPAWTITTPYSSVSQARNHLYTYQKNKCNRNDVWVETCSYRWIGVLVRETKSCLENVNNAVMSMQALT